MASDLTHINPGDKLAVKASGSSWHGHRPRITHSIFVVSRTTATQIIAEYALGTPVSVGREIRVHKKNGAISGHNYQHAEQATDEMVETIKDQIRTYHRYVAAEDFMKDLIGREAHQLNLTLEQVEYLARAWENVKAMAPKSTPTTPN